MKITGSYTFDAPQQDVWDLLMDPHVIAKAMPGVDQFTPVGPNQYEAQMKVGLGAVSGQYAARFTLSDINPITSYTMTINGKGQRGFVNGTGEVRLEPDGDKTICHYVGDAALGGQLAGVAQRLVEGAGRTVINQGFKSLDAELAQRRAPAIAPPAEVAPAPEGAPGAAPTPTPAPIWTRPAPAPSAVPSNPFLWIVVGAVGMAIILWLFDRRK
ncbi:MAG: SRPBCC family protein [Anaerolineae bacterium]|nr:SRPBCC family protein [Anaerolineae bacterium]